ncbi:MAG: EpsG family protein [Ferruginibacter sp.]
MLVYIIYFVVIACFAVEYEFRPFESNTLLGILIVAMALLAGLRGENIDKDYDNYIYSFEMLYNTNNLLIFTLYEPGYIAIVRLVRLLFDVNYPVVILLFCAFVSVFLKITNIKKLAINPYLAILFYFSHYFLLHEMTQIRIGLAAALFFVAISYYLKGERIKFVGIVLLACLFHYSAIFYLFVLFFDTVSFNRIIYFSLILLSFLLAFVHVPFTGYLNNLNLGDVSSKLEIYTEMNIFDNINVLNLLNLCNIFACTYLIFFTPAKVLITDKRLIFFLKCNIFSIFLLSFLSEVPGITFRFSQLFGVVAMFVFCYLAKFLPFSKFNIFFVILIGAVFLYYNISKTGIIGSYHITSFK